MKLLSDEKSRIWIYIVVAYLFSFAVRMIWVHWASGNPQFFWNGQLMINTNDGYFFGAGAQHVLEGLHADNPRIPGFWNYGVVAITVWLTQYTPFSLETVMLYLPAVVSSLIVIPLILIGRLFGQTLWGFLAAILGAVTWSYYNRTMTGYYDTDMFSVMAPMFILYFLMKSVVEFDRRSALYAAIAIAVYPFLYDQGKSLIYAMGLIYAAYLIWQHREERTTYESLILVLTALIPFGLSVPWEYLTHLLLVIGIYFLLRLRSFPLKPLMATSGVLLILLLIFGDVFALVFSKIQGYLATGTQTEGNLHFYSVAQTVREAGQIPFDIFAKRISGSVVGFFLGIAGYLLLLRKHPPFLLSLPLMGIGFFAWWGGLRFTVYAVPVMALGVVYFFFWMGEYFRNRRIAMLLSILGTTVLLVPNLLHIIEYKVPTVMNRVEVEDLVKLDQNASSRDYTLAWWDYGYPIWFYSDTSTLIDGGKHNEDNFIVSTILQTDSPLLAANLGRTAVETYANDPAHGTAALKLFAKKDPNLVLTEMESGEYRLPPKSREIYLYLPYRVLEIFPTVMKFSNLDLSTGKPLRKPLFIVTRPASIHGNVMRLYGGFAIDLKKGMLIERTREVPLHRVVVATLRKDLSIKTVVLSGHEEGDYTVIVLKSYGKVVIMDNRTFRSLYVQMFMLGNYDEKLFEPVVLSPYTRIFRFKR